MAVIRKLIFINRYSWFRRLLNRNCFFTEYTSLVEFNQVFSYCYSRSSTLFILLTSQLYHLLFVTLQNSFEIPLISSGHAKGFYYRPKPLILLWKVSKWINPFRMTFITDQHKNQPMIVSIFPNNARKYLHFPAQGLDRLSFPSLRPPIYFTVTDENNNIRATFTRLVLRIPMNCKISYRNNT